MFGKQTLHQLSCQQHKSIRTLQREFDKLTIDCSFLAPSNKPVNLIVDATFFSRAEGVLVFRANGKNIFWRFIQTESKQEMALCLDALDEMGYQFKSITLDGKKGLIFLFKARYPTIPIQLCQFHQTQIIRRYTTNNPKTECGIKLKSIMRCLTDTTQDVFESLVNTLKEEYDCFLKERNENGDFKHKQLRSALRSLKSNMPYLFTYKNFPELIIPNTTNSCDGSFAHWKQKLKIHRGLRKHRRNKMINYLLMYS